MNTIANKPGLIGSPADEQLARVIRILAIFELALIAATWRLWTGHSDFPVVPLLHPEWTSVRFDRALLIPFAVSLVCLASGLRGFRLAQVTAIRLTTFSCAALLCIGNTHRLQVWHWLFLLCVGQSCLLNPGGSLKAVRLTVASVYMLSALSRLFAEAPDVIAAEILRRLIQLRGPGIPLADDKLLATVGFLFAAFEFAIGLLLLIPRTRQMAVRLSVVLHLLLLLALGPLGLGHRPGVLIWNVMFLTLNPVLFRPIRLSQFPQSSGQPDQGISAAVMKRDASTLCVVGSLVILFPLSGLFGLADNWLSWQVYSGRPESWRIFIATKNIEQLPASLRAFCDRQSPPQPWTPVRLDRWSLEATRAPIYPEDRFQLAVIERLVSQLPPDADIYVVAREPGGLPWLPAKERRIGGREELTAEHSRFVFNSFPAAE